MGTLSSADLRRIEAAAAGITAMMKPRPEPVAPARPARKAVAPAPKVSCRIRAADRHAEECAREMLAAAGIDAPAGLLGRAALDACPAPVATWTPKLVGERLVEAVKWAGRSAGPVGPAGLSTVRLAYLAHLDPDWGVIEVAGDDRPEERQLRIPPTPRQITAFEDALDWPRRYLCPEYEGSARILALWVRCKATRMAFNAAVKARGTIARATAFRLRDRGLSLIAQGLEREGVALGRD